MADKIDQIPLFAGVENMLHVLSSSAILLILITRNSHHNVCKILKPNNMALMVDHQYGTSLFGKRSKLKNILRKTGIDPSQAIYIGDEIRDLKAANAENIDFGAVSWGYTRIDALMEHSPAEIFHRVDEIVGKIVQHNVQQAPSRFIGGFPALSLYCSHAEPRSPLWPDRDMPCEKRKGRLAIHEATFTLNIIQYEIVFIKSVFHKIRQEQRWPSICR